MNAAQAMTTHGFFMADTAGELIHAGCSRGGAASSELSYIPHKPNAGYSRFTVTHDFLGMIVRQTDSLPLDGGGSETCQLAGLVAAVGVRSRPEATVQGRTITPIQLRLAASRQGCVSFPHQGGRFSDRNRRVAGQFAS